MLRKGLRPASRAVQVLYLSPRVSNIAPPSAASSVGLPLLTRPLSESTSSRFPAEDNNQRDCFPVDVPIEEAWTPPSAWYTCPTIFEEEKEKIFARNWVYAGRSEQVAEPGQFITGWNRDTPYIVVRSEDGQLRSFFNVCRHHANILVNDPQNQGKLDKFVCCYHGWTYALDGKLTKATKLKGIKNFSPKDFGLIEIPVTEWETFVFLHMGPCGEGRKFKMKPEEVPDLHKRLEPLKEIIHKTFGPLNNMEWVARKTFMVNCNWKIVNDNYLDGEYHIPYVHPGLNSQLNMKTYHTKLYDKFNIQFAESAHSNSSASDVKVGQDFSERVGEKAVYAMLYPNFAINRYGAMMDINQVIPLAVNKTAVVYDFYFEKGLNQGKDFVEKCIAASSIVQEEDSLICENLQKGLASFGYEKGRYAPSVELGTHHFHQLYAADLL
jgi:choline monooxygenase